MAVLEPHRNIASDLAASASSRVGPPRPPALRWRRLHLPHRAPVSCADHPRLQAETTGTAAGKRAAHDRRRPGATPLQPQRSARSTRGADAHFGAPAMRIDSPGPLAGPATSQGIDRPVRRGTRDARAGPRLEGSSSAGAPRAGFGLRFVIRGPGRAGGRPRRSPRPGRTAHPCTRLVFPDRRGRTDPAPPPAPSRSCSRPPGRPAPSPHRP